MAFREDNDCRSACRVGKEQCDGFRIATVDLDAAVLNHVANAACTPERTRDLFKHLSIKKTQPQIDEQAMASMWRSLITADASIGRSYARHSIQQIIVYGKRIELVAQPRETIATSVTLPP